ESFGAVFRGRACKCPWHDDRNASAGIYQKNGAWRFKCQGLSCGVEGDIFDIRALIQNKPVEEIISEHVKHMRPNISVPPGPPPPDRNNKPFIYKSYDDIAAHYTREIGDIEAQYPYRHPDTKQTELMIYRIIDRKTGKKTFRQASPRANGFVTLEPVGKLP